MGFLLLIYAAIASMSLFMLMVSANMDLFAPLRTRLDSLLSDDKISKHQYDHIVHNLVVDDKILDVSMEDHTERPPLSESQIEVFINWIKVEVSKGRLENKTSRLLCNLFNLHLSSAKGGIFAEISSVPDGPAPTKYDVNTNGVVDFVGRKDFIDTFWLFGYSGIWGYSTGNREYALQCNSFGLNILDVTTSNVVLLQTISMSGGTTWRDVATHKNYAYVGAQGSGSVSNAWIINLEKLSGDQIQGANSSPIPATHIKDIGYPNYGHTINVDKGLLFLNTAKYNIGCAIFDLEDPWNPKELVISTVQLNQQFGDCHDSFVQTIDNIDILISSDGRDEEWTFSDITNIRTNPRSISVFSATPFLDGRVYAHESCVSDDGKTLFAFDEFNEFDIAAYDISVPSAPKLIRKFQWSGESTENCKVHNGFSRGDYLYVAYYEAGLRVFDISDIHNSVFEVGKYETYRDPDGDGNFDEQIKGDYQGAWNVYVGLPSGKVLVSDRDYGTFVFNIAPLTPSSPPTMYPTISGNPSITPTTTTKPSFIPSLSPSDNPSLSPTVCPQPDDARFLYKKKGTKIKTKPCKWLIKGDRKKHCEKKIHSTSEFAAPANACKVTCDTCDPMTEIKKARYFVKITKKDKILTATCKGLKKKNRSKITKICAELTETEDGYGPPLEVCPQTCAAPSASPSNFPSMNPAFRVWYDFSKDSPLVDIPVNFEGGVEKYTIRAPCPLPWFKLLLFGHHGQTSAVELSVDHGNKGQIYCNGGGNQLWWGGEKTEFYYSGKGCSDNDVSIDIIIEKTTEYYAVYNGDKLLFNKSIVSNDGLCPEASHEIGTQQYEEGKFSLSSNSL